MRLLSVAAAAAALASTGCKPQSLEPRSRFVEDGVTRDAGEDWAGEAIDIDNTGVTATGGLSIAGDGERTKVAAVARLLALRATLDKPGADDAIGMAKATFLVTTTVAPPRSTHVTCGAIAGTGEDSAGCDALDVPLPYGYH